MAEVLDPPAEKTISKNTDNSDAVAEMLLKGVQKQEESRKSKENNQQSNVDNQSTQAAV